MDGTLMGGIGIVAGAVIAAAAGILTSIITYWAQIKIQRENNSSQLKLADKKSERDAREATLDKLADVHKILSRIEREYYKGKTDSIQKESISTSDFEARYDGLCEKADKLLAIVTIYADNANLTTTCQELRNMMINFQVYFFHVLEFKERGQEDHDRFRINGAEALTLAIRKKVESAQYQLAYIAQKIQKIDWRFVKTFWPDWLLSHRPL